VLRIPLAVAAILTALIAPSAALPSTGTPAGARAESAGSWRWPTDATRQVIRGFVAPAERWSAGHRGVDIAAGTQLRAPADGIVRYAGWVVDRPVLSIDHGAALSSYEPVDALVEAGDRVTAGEVIGTIEPGHCRTLCVHMGVRVDGDDDGYRNPLLWLGGVPRSILLPTRQIS